MQTKNPIIKPILLIIAVLICLAMVRLGFWQLDRAQQKKSILSQSITLSEQAAIDLKSLLPRFDTDLNKLRFRQVTTVGEYLDEQSILIDNQVFESKVGYALITPFKFAASGEIILVDRGWLSVGQSRDVLPEFATPKGELSLNGRLNLPYAKPPIWNDDYDVSTGTVWQYLPIDEFRQQSGLSVLPLVLELAPNSDVDLAHSGARINWQSINDEWVFKHQAYAVQWFAMAVVFFIACLIVLIKSVRQSKANSD